MKVKIKDGGIYRTVEIPTSDYGIYLKEGYTKVVEEPTTVEEEPIKVVEEPTMVEEEMPKSKKRKKRSEQ